MIKVELSRKLGRPDGLSDPDSQGEVSGQAGDWLETTMPGVMRTTEQLY